MSRVKNINKKTEQDKKQCTKCLKSKKSNTDFYMSYSIAHSDGRMPICKQCIFEIAGENYKDVQTALRMIDRPWLPHLWQSALEDKRETLGAYFVLINAKDFRHLTWADSELENQVQLENTNSKNANKDNMQITEEMISKWGEGYTPEEYRSFERKYQMLKNNYQEKTAMHTEALLTYIRYRVKEELATAKGQVKDAKDWGALAQQAATNAKINPSQLSKSDLSDGLDTFGQLVRTVEQAVDIIPILPKFKEKPQDKVDFTILCYVNYVRDLKGLPPAEYDEIYKFYEERKKEYENRLDFIKEDES